MKNSNSPANLILGFIGLIGVCMLAVAIYMACRECSFIGRASQAHGRVTELVWQSSGKGGSYSPRVEFTTAAGEKTRFLSHSGSNPPAFGRGEKVEVLYLPDQPEQAQIKAFFSMWKVVLICGFLGIVFTLIGVGPFFARSRNRKKAEWLQLYGLPVDATLEGAHPNTSYAVNGRNPYKITAQWLDPSTNTVHVFESENLWFDPSEFLKEKTVKVWLDQNNPKRYYMDISFLPQMA